MRSRSKVCRPAKGIFITDVLDKSLRGDRGVYYGINFVELKGTYNSKIFSMPSKALLLIVTRLLFPLRDLEMCKSKEFLRNRKSSSKAHLQFGNFRSTKRVIRNGSQLIVIKGSERIRNLVDDFFNLCKN